MAHKPKADHPWRQYKNRPRKKKTEVVEKVDDSKLSLRDFLGDMVNCWDSFKIPSIDPSIDCFIRNLQDTAISSWLAEFLKKHYSSRESYML